MSRMSELHADLVAIHQILLGQRKVASDNLRVARLNTPLEVSMYMSRIECIDDLLLEFEAAGVVWPSVTTDGRKPDNVVSINGREDEATLPCKCGGDLHPEHGPWG